MNRILLGTLFLSIVGSILFLLNWYVLGRLGGLLGAKRLPLLLMAAGATLLFILGHAIAANYHNAATKALYAATATWLGVLFLAFCTLLLFELVNLFLKTDRRLAAYVVISVVLVISLIAIIANLFLVEKEVTIPVKGLERELRIVQLSDLHVGTMRNAGSLARVAARTNGLEPDLVVITGDLVDGSAPLHPAMFDALNRIEAPVYFVIGNHEQYEGLESVLAVLKTTKLKVVRNERIDIDGLQLVGLDNTESDKEVRRVLATIPLDKGLPSVLLLHTPVGSEAAQQAGIDVQLSGHTHNGQLWPFTLLGKLVYHRNNGLYDVDGLHLYVSPGTGTWGPPMRLGSLNEITVITLQPWKGETP